MRRTGDGRLDKRLQRRQEVMSEAVLHDPSASFPDQFPVRKDLDGAYSLFSNERARPWLMLAPHVIQTVSRCEKAGQVLIISDGTEFTFSGDREGLGPLTTGRGFLGHFSIALREYDRHVLGVMDARLWVRPERKVEGRTHRQVYRSDDKESLVWMKNVRASELALAGRAQAIHVMDSGADDYAQFSEFDELGLNYVVRLRHNRTLVDDNVDHLFDALEGAPLILERTIELASRKNGDAAPKQKRLHPDRSARTARLSVCATSVNVQRPHTSRPEFQETVRFNVVRVREDAPPPDTAPVEWLISTNLPVATREDLARVLDAYRARWVIEEYFKALKSGCSVEARQLESAHALMNMTAFFAPVAARLLELRDAARHHPNQAAAGILDATELFVLTAMAIVALPKAPTLREAYLAIAKLGGHLKSNGDPGWMVLSRGYDKLRTAVQYQRALDDRNK